MTWGLVFILSGAIVAIFNNPLARWYVAYQNQTFGFKFGKREVTVGRILNIIVGIIFIIFGTLIMTGIIEAR